ncbi:RNA polymerase factor sigma-54 [Kiritimatiella glycovorans]|uniref:RNA polymerase sigma-54 factor 1 n=1 Tax=Kiritimatiella glycovorans TaxID=1307763 RepID=A0A0G3EIT8_9BACT|nr:RNA polymerase factor sigma-54 [Kiritimatiella glycovorans]AKJ65317.1 RNA polymerase sigma-54 factor 1 [Kiritimatiella glycovorans]
MAQQVLTQSQTQQLQQVLAPHLRQSLEVLQVPVLDLRALIRREMEQNPTLEEPPAEETEQVEVEPGTSDIERELEEDFADEFAQLAQLDDEWRDYFRQNRAVMPSSQDAEEKRQYFLDSVTESLSLQEHLMHQLTLSDVDASERKVGELLIGSIDDDGYLSSDPEEFERNTGVACDRLERVLKVIQDFDPLGVGARTVQECLLIQLDRLGKKPGDPVWTLVEHHLDLLGAHKYDEIARTMDISAARVDSLARFISTLEPRPGRKFSSERAEYVVPELSIQKVDGEYVVRQKDEYIPPVRISRYYRKLLEDPSTAQDVKKYVREKIRGGMLLIKSIDQRQQTLYKIALEIVRVQRDFFEHGVSHLKPLRMSDVAAKLGVHETTVSRATSNKYIQTPLGTYEMKFFFRTGYRRADGTEVSNEGVKAALSRLVEQEDPARPLSDQAIAEKLREQGLEIARRTVAKYREQLNILPSNLRRKR